MGDPDSTCEKKQADCQDVELLKWEYERGSDLFFHYDSSSWTIASILLAVVSGLTGFSFLNNTHPTILAILSVFVYVGWIFLDRRLTFYNHTILATLQSLEDDCLKLQVKLHSRINSEDKKHHWWNLTPKMRQVLYPPIAYLIAFWMHKLSPLFSASDAIISGSAGFLLILTLLWVETESSHQGGIGKWWKSR